MFGIEPSADLRQMAGTLWQIFVALKEQGFDDEQALRLLQTFIRANAAKGPDE